MNVNNLRIFAFFQDIYHRLQTSAFPKLQDLEILVLDLGHDRQEAQRVCVDTTAPISLVVCFQLRVPVGNALFSRENGTARVMRNPFPLIVHKKLRC